MDIGVASSSRLLQIELRWTRVYRHLFFKPLPFVVVLIYPKTFLYPILKFLNIPYCFPGHLPYFSIPQHKGCSSKCLLHMSIAFLMGVWSFRDPLSISVTLCGTFLLAYRCKSTLWVPGEEVRLKRNVRTVLSWATDKVDFQGSRSHILSKTTVQTQVRIRSCLRAESSRRLTRRLGQSAIEIGNR